MIDFKIKIISFIQQSYFFGIIYECISIKGHKMQIEQGVYQHYKGPYYEVYDVVYHSETEEALVLYKPLYENKTGGERLWVRPLNMFFETVVVAGAEVPRFKKVNNEV
jgi:hypothetical protein